MLTTLFSLAVIALFCRQYDIIKDNDNSNSKEKVKPLSERSTPEHHSGGLLRSKVRKLSHVLFMVMYITLTQATVFLEQYNTKKTCIKCLAYDLFFY